ncbi:HAUS augmin-like complex subunit 2 [Megalops cyprinoides]|uniref:HAUS augmin-like complex subunit 2 n=1 Tax=Megalops cyprinoides TaxID=118141 RepID=UPI001863FF87|nr:HAUS augmin-like complex subunit 2 [Megalops cyprinoides]XP_036397451.1 HAUS augmin-like complex subunit 2 [Megalops cyprinoides]XP_036397453.1 HAUS augmin-like complex subunit 2 [Megalops cyprinoides]
MNPWDPVPYSATPAAQVLARCVASGVLSQADLDAVPRGTQVFSSQLLEAEQVADMKYQIDQKNFELELLMLEKESADVTHTFYLSKKFAALQQFTFHLQDVLREQASLRQRLMKPLCQQNLTIEADLQRYVVELMGMVLDLIENFEDKVKITQSFPTLGQSMASLNNALAQLLTQVTEVEGLSWQVLHWKDRKHSMIINNNDTSA